MKEKLNEKDFSNRKFYKSDEYLNFEILNIDEAFSFNAQCRCIQKWKRKNLIWQKMEQYIQYILKLYLLYKTITYTYKKKYNEKL